MGGAGGHMIHPYQCPEVKNGQDLIAFYIRAVQSIEDNPPSIKLDGVNVSFRLKQIPSYPGFEFVVDRGSKTVPLDLEGITADNAHVRFVSGDPNKPHGMVKATQTLTMILNSDRENLKPYLEELGVFDRMGPYGIFFNAEFYSNKDGDGVGNVTSYNKNFIAIHGLGEFYKNQQGNRDKRSVYQDLEDQINDLKQEIEEAYVNGENVNDLQEELQFAIQEYHNKKNNHKKILNDISRELQDNANKVDFQSFSTIPVKFKGEESTESIIEKINEALDKEWTFLHKNFYLQNKNNEQYEGPMGIGPGKVNTETGDFSGRTLREHLENIKTNPEHQSSDVRVSDYYFREILKKERNPKNDSERTRYVFSQDIYQAVAENDIGVADIAYQNEDVGPINDAVVIWHTIRVLGNVIKQALTSDVDLGLPIYEQEGVVLQAPDTCTGASFKITGEFFLDNRNKETGDKKHKVGEMLHEVKLYEQEEAKRHVILIPGGFKPPTGGHYSMIKQYDNKVDVIKVYVVTGDVKRDGVTLQQSKQIFDLYGGFSDKVEFIEANHPTPLTTCYKLMQEPEFIKKHPDAYFAIGASDKGDDPKRIKDFVTYFIKNKGITTAKIRYYEPAKTHTVRGEPASASRMRKAFATGDWELFKELLPNPNLYDNVVRILNGQGEGPVNENFLLAVPRSFLVEGEKANPWAICTAQVGRENEKKYESCVKQVKKKHNISEELNEPETVMASPSEAAADSSQAQKVPPEEIEKLRQELSGMFKIVLPRLGLSADMETDTFEAVVATVADDLTKAKEEDNQEKADERKKQGNNLGAMAEASAMAGAGGGSVEGAAGGSAWINFQGEDNEQKTRVT